jgi:hypothetical protein
MDCASLRVCSQFHFESFLLNPTSYPICFDNHAKPFSHKSFGLIFIQNPRGVGGSQGSLSSPSQYFPVTTFRMNTYKKCASNPCRMNTCGAKDLKSLCFQHLQKTGGGVGLLSADRERFVRGANHEGRTFLTSLPRYIITSTLRYSGGLKYAAPWRNSPADGMACEKTIRIGTKIAPLPGV